MKFIVKVAILVGLIASLTDIYSFLENHQEFLSSPESPKQSIPVQAEEPNSAGEQFCSTFPDDEGCLQGRLLSQREPISYHQSSQRENVGTNLQAFCARFPNDYSCK